ncbi:hypothetical protein OIU84_011657 [Salix udensis]|uniref:Uncharacterized protein n=1 Tax=Salix udensis TaxID=889485 RepID=A0AAD6JNN6_9ROSI|nr:hypothetical protein OIU84_011657 [Salix udensis]
MGQIKFQREESRESPVRVCLSIDDDIFCRSHIPNSRALGGTATTIVSYEGGREGTCSARPAKSSLQHEEGIFIAALERESKQPTTLRWKVTAQRVVGDFGRATNPGDKDSEGCRLLILLQTTSL